MSPSLHWEDLTKRAAPTQAHCDLTKGAPVELVNVTVDVSFSHWEVLTKRAAHTQDHCDLTKGATVELVHVTVDVAFSRWEVLTKRAAEQPTLKTTVI